MQRDVLPDIYEALLQPNGAAFAREPDPPEADIQELNPEFPVHAFRGVFADYREAMVGTTEASDVAHFASLWVSLAATLGRTVSMYAGDVLYPNVYLAFFGSTGDKKTTAMRRPSALRLIPDHVTLVQNVGSTEGLADKLKREDDNDTVALFYWEEFAALLARGRWSGSTVLEFLTEAFDCPSTWGLEYRRNKVEIHRPTPSILTGTTPEWFWKHAKSEDFYGGFGNRFVFLKGDRKPPIPNPIQPNLTKVQCVRDAFERIAQIGHTSAEFDAAAASVWGKYYLQSELQRPEGLLGAATKRIHVVVRKLCMVYAAVEGTLPFITEDQLRASISVGRYAFLSMKSLLEVQAVGRSRDGELEQRFLEWLRKHNGRARKRDMQQTLSKACGDCETFNRVVRNLEQAGYIEIRDREVLLRG